MYYNLDKRGVASYYIRHHEISKSILFPDIIVKLYFNFDQQDLLITLIIRRFFIMDFLFDGIKNITFGQLVMYIIGVFMILIAIKKNLEPTLLIPMGFGTILVNIPFSGAIGENGAIEWLFNVGIKASEIMPLLLFIGIGAMLDFTPLISNPKLFLIGAFAQSGIFITIILATILGFNIKDAACIGIIGAADGPTSILVAQTLHSNYLGAITISAYCYMSLVPFILPLVTRLCTTKKERLIRMEYNTSKISKGNKLLFPIVITIVAGTFTPDAISLIGFLMFGNLIKECGVLNHLTSTATTTLTNLITLLLGITISFTMQANLFLSIETLMIMGLGLFAFIFDAIGGIFFVKIINLFTKKKINPMIGAAGISAFPMASRIVHQMGVKEDKGNYLLMHAASTNMAGQIASAIVGGIILSFF